MMRRRLEHARIDRTGLALAAGGIATGAIAAALYALGGAASVVELLAAFGLASLVVTPFVAVYGGVIWLAVRRAGLTGPGAAALSGLIGSVLLVVLVQLHPDMLGGAAAPYRWFSALTMSALFAPFGVGIALLMWRIAYRRLG